LFRRFTLPELWEKQPALDDNQLQRLVRLRGRRERRSTTRYLADVTYHFNPAAVRVVLRQAHIAYTETRSKPALVIPLIDGKGFAAPVYGRSLEGPCLHSGTRADDPAAGDAEDMAVLSRR